MVNNFYVLYIKFFLSFRFNNDTIVGMQNREQIFRIFILILQNIIFLASIVIGLLRKSKNISNNSIVPFAINHGFAE